MEQLVNFVIRPPRADYNPSSDLLQEKFTLKGRRFQRKDLEVANEYGHALKCSHYLPYPVPETRSMPCVIYCHGNSGCRADAIEAVLVLLTSNITVFTLDFSGSGLSDGEYVTLGWKEKDDLKAVVNFLRADEHVSCIGLWGRSMGAVTSLMYGAEDLSIAGIVLDSPFANLVELMMELVDMYKIRLPKFTVKVAIQYMRKAIQKKAQFDIMDLDITKVAAKSFIPALFGHATEDAFIQPRHSDLLFNSYAGDKNIIKFEGDHNSPRPQFYYDSISIFFHNVLHPPDEIPQESVSNCLDDYFDAFGDMDESAFLGTLDGSSDAQNVSSGNNIDARWHMSRIDVPFGLEGNSENVLDFAQENDSSRSGVQPSNLQISMSRDTENNPESTFSTDTINSSSYIPQGFESNQNRATGFLPSHGLSNTFANYPMSTMDEERMIMEAIAASLQNVEIEEPSKSQSLESAKTISSLDISGKADEKACDHFEGDTSEIGTSKPSR